MKWTSHRGKEQSPGLENLKVMRNESITDCDRWMDMLERSACCGDQLLAGNLDRLKSRSAVSVKLLSGPILEQLTAAASKLSFRSARYEAGKPEARVYQEFDYCGVVPAGHPVRHLGRWYEARLHRALALMTEPPMTTDYTINDVVCQRYRPGGLGITPHRDHIAYTQLITLVVLGGRGRYFVCADRRGSNRQEIVSAPGRVILMPGPGYAGRSDRPFHMVGDITRLRYSVGLRQDAGKARPGATG